MLGLKNEVKENLLKGYQYEISGEYKFSQTNFSFDLNKETISIQLRDNKFELMIGKSTFSDYYIKMNKQADALSNSEQQHNKRKRSF